MNYFKLHKLEFKQLINRIRTIVSYGYSSFFFFFLKEQFLLLLVKLILSFNKSKK